MLCMKCNKKEANVYYKQNINGKVTELTLCSDCAKEAQQSLNLNSVFSFNPFAGLFDAPSVRAPAEDTKKRCTLCGASFQDLVKSGKVGCAKCYEVFAAELAPTIQSIHGNAEYIGRAPSKGQDEKKMRQNRVKQLMEEQKKAIEAQDFEKAALLRDEIKKLNEEA